MMLVNSIDISNFKAKLLSRNIGTAKFEIINEWSPKANSPFVKFELIL